MFDVLEDFFFSFTQRVSFPSVGVFCWRQSNPPRSQNPNRPNMKGKCNYPALFQINWTPPPINAELFLFILTHLSPPSSEVRPASAFCLWDIVREKVKCERSRDLIRGKMHPSEFLLVSEHVKRMNHNLAQNILSCILFINNSSLAALFEHRVNVKRLCVVHSYI